MKYETCHHPDLITEMYKQYSGRVKLYFLRYTHDEMRAEDMVQDLFLKLMSYEELIAGETAKHLLFTIARRMVVDDARYQEFVRRAKQGYMLKMEEKRFWQEPETLECKQLHEMELAALSRLPRKMAQVYRLTRFEEKTSQELTEQLGISKRTVEYHLFVSRREIRRMLKQAVNQ